MTNHWTDIQFVKLFLVLGATPVENHPVVTQYLNQALDKGAKMIVVDPRRTRTAALAVARGGYHLRIRPGTNGAFIMGVINYLLTNNKYDAAYQVNPANRTFTNASGAAVTRSVPKWTDALFKLNSDGQDYQRVVAGEIAGDAYVGMPRIATSLNDSDTVFAKLKARAAHYTPAVVAGICGCTAAEFTNVCNIIGEGRGDDSVAGGLGSNKGSLYPASILYALGATMHSHAVQDLRGYAILQMLLGCMGRPGGGVNALRGIHNVQGSTDMGCLCSEVPGYSGVPQVSGPDDYGTYMDKLFGGARLKDPGTGTWYNQSPPAGVAQAGWNLQQHGFRNMMHWYFRQGSDPFAGDYEDGANLQNKNFDLMPKGNGYNHRQFYQQMKLADGDANRIRCYVAYGTNPVVGDANVKEIKAGLKNLDTLVVVDNFETETAGCERRDDGVTYALPAAVFAEHPGTITNSGRWVQWRYQCGKPKGGSKTDDEILLCFAKALDAKGAFNHIPMPSGFSDRYTALYGDQYGWDGVSAYNEGDHADTVAENIFKQMSHRTQNGTGYGALWIYRGAWGGWARNYLTFASTTLAASASKGATSIDCVLINNAQVVKGTVLWIGSGDAKEQVCVASTPSGNTLTLVKPLTKDHLANEPVEHVLNRAKARGMLDVGENGVDSGKEIYANWTWAWLKNRRVLYNNNNADYGTTANDPVPGDIKDAFVASDQVACYFVHHTTQHASMPNTVAYATTYREYKKLGDLNGGDGSTTGGTSPVDTRLQGATMPKHWEPFESPNSAHVAKYGNTGVAPIDAIGDAAEFPLAVTTIRNTEHFQTGTHTRNVPWLCELAPEPWIEMNLVDANAQKIKDGDQVYISSARATNIGPFRAKVGAGLAAQQYVAPGVVAVPWHWGRVYLHNKPGETPSPVYVSEGASANDFTIDSQDMTSLIPEYKACLCRVHKNKI
jgi:anaerobic selenocysteine-containing dehydrogenase